MAWKLFGGGKAKSETEPRAVTLPLTELVGKYRAMVFNSKRETVLISLKTLQLHLDPYNPMRAAEDCTTLLPILSDLKQLSTDELLVEAERSIQIMQSGMELPNANPQHLLRLALLVVEAVQSVPPMSEED